MKSSTQVILPLLVLAGMLRNAHGCFGYGRLRCIATNGCKLSLRGCVRISNPRPRPPRAAQATLFNIIPSDSDADRHDHKLLTKGRPDQEDYAIDINMDIDSTGHSESGDDVSDEYDDDLYLYEDEDMDEDEDIKNDFNSH